MEKIKPNCKKSKPCSECGKCKPKKVNTTEENINIEKFKAKCEKKLRFLESFDPTVDNLINLIEPIALSLNSDIDDETLNRIIEHPKRLLYHANEILNIDNMATIEKVNTQDLKIVIMFHDIGKAVKFKKYNAEMKKDHHVFSSIILQTAMTYMGFDSKRISDICWDVYDHNAREFTKEQCLERSIIYQILLDVDKIDEHDVYGMILKSIVKGYENKVKRNNIINQNDLKDWIANFVENDDVYERLLLHKSKVYYKHHVQTNVSKLISMIDYTRKDDLF